MTEDFINRMKKLLSFESSFFDDLAVILVAGKKTAVQSGKIG
ncbi:hypothetical protein QY96_03388 [Bacillus thermotolerans]|nr:hypothetical protein QY96_03388 [Bacillus thermotolerans]